MSRMSLSNMKLAVNLSKGAIRRCFSHLSIRSGVFNGNHSPELFVMEAMGGVGAGS